MEKLTPSTKTIRLSYSDPDATDSSSDEESGKTQKKLKRKVHEIEVEFVEKNKNPRSDSGNFQEKMGFKKPNLTSEGKKIIGVRMTESGKFCARIRDPIEKRRVWLGTFATAEASSRAYLAKDSKFTELRTKQRAKRVTSEKSPFPDPVPSVLERDTSGLTSFHKGFEKPNPTSEGNKFVGVRMTKSGKFGAAIRDPCETRSVWLGSFATPEEASGAYLAKNSQFAAKLRAKQRIDHSDLTSFQKGETKRISGVRRRDSGKFSAEIRNPITKSRVWIGTFATEEEASRAYLTKKSQFAAELRAQQRIDWVTDNDYSDLTSLRKGETKRISGVRRRDSGKFSTEIRNPITKRRVWIGTFATEEEASRAYLAKKSQFAVELRAQQRIDWVTDNDYSDLTSLQKGERKRISGVRMRSWGKFCAEITNPITKRRVWIGTFATEEEAYRAYLAKEAEFEDELRAKQGSEKSLAAPDSVPSVLEIETSDLSNESVGESVGENKLSGNQEAEFGFLFGVQVVDKNGFLVGEFSVLDDLSICSEEEDVNS